MDPDEQSASTGEPAGRARWPGRAAAAVARHRWRSALVLVVVLAAAATVTVAVTRARHGWDERISGPYGAYPAAFPAGAPTRLLRQVDGTSTLAGGLALVPFAGPDSGGVRAVNVRTGRVYWTDQRSGRVLYTAAGPGDSAYLLWDDGLLTRVDARRARIRWQYRLDLGDEGGAIWGADTRSVVVVSQQRAVTLSTAGAVRWTATPPAGRIFDPGWPVLLANTVALDTQPRTLPGGNWSYVLRAYDRGSGRLRWQRTDAHTPPVPLAAGADTILVHDDIDNDAVRIDGTTGHRAGPLQSGPVSALVADSRYVAGESDGYHLGAWDARTGKLLWTKRFRRNEYVGTSIGPFAAEQAGTQVGEDPPSVCCIALAGGLLDVVSVSSGPHTLNIGSGTSRPDRQLWLTAYDPRTGALVHRTRIPVILPRSLHGAGRTAVDTYRTSIEAEITAATTDGLLAVTEEGPGMPGTTVILAP